MSLINQVIKLTEQYTIKVVTLDVFDTMLLRNTKSEYQRFLELSKQLSKRLSKIGIGISSDELFYMRCITHQFSYQCVDIYQHERDASLEFMIQIMMNYLSIHDFSFKEEFLINEINYEKNNLSMNPEIREVLSYLENSNIPWFYLSDMYLSSTMIDELIYYFYPKVQDIMGYVSNEINQTKKGGGLFNYFCMHEKYDPSQILHIGDNLQSDYRVPINKGIQSIFYPRSQVWQVVNQLRQKWSQYHFKGIMIKQ